MYQRVVRALRRRGEAFVRSGLFGGAGLEWKMTSGRTAQVRSVSEWTVFCSLFVDGEYDPAIRDAIASAGPGNPVHVLDLGANVGFFGIRFLDLVEQIRGSDTDCRLVLVEGSPCNAQELRRRIPEGPTVRIVNALVGQRAGRATIFEHEFAAANSVNNPVMRRVGRGVDVDFVDIETLVADWPTIDLIKCDIEGSEQAFIETYGALLRRARRIVLEFHPELVDVAKCRAALAECGLVQADMLRTASNQSVEYFCRPAEA